jgi:hypothetical protein
MLSVLMSELMAVPTADTWSRPMRSWMLAWLRRMRQ